MILWLYRDDRGHSSIITILKKVDVSHSSPTAGTPALLTPNAIGSWQLQKGRGRSPYYTTKPMVWLGAASAKSQCSILIVMLANQTGMVSNQWHHPVNRLQHVKANANCRWREWLETNLCKIGLCIHAAQHPYCEHRSQRALNQNGWHPSTEYATLNTPPTVLFSENTAKKL